jgi:hypothetical protein
MGTSDYNYVRNDNDDDIIIIIIIHMILLQYFTITRTTLFWGNSSKYSSRCFISSYL